MQDARDDNVQESRFDRDTPHGIALFIALLTVSCSAFFRVVSNHVWSSLDSFRKLFDDQTNVIESLLLAEANGRKHCVLACFPEPFIRDLIDALTQDG